jgi:hypothetical protein
MESVVDTASLTEYLMDCERTLGYRLLEHWDREFESESRYACLCAFILCLCSV